jgi:hypothetical protein
MTGNPPEPSDGDVDYLKLAAALLLEGAIFQTRVSARTKVT